MTQLLEQYFEHLSGLPEDLAKNLKQIRELDIEVEKKSCEVETKMKNFVKTHKSLSRDATANVHKDVATLFEEIDRLSDEKIRLASDTYELVDTHIRRLDNDSAKLQASMRQKFLDAAEKLSGYEDESGNEKKKRGVMARKDKKRKEDVRTPTRQEPSTSNAGFQPFLDTTPIVEMPVDPNEPTYCICHQVSYGEMVMCDNKHCPIEWFHFQCVGLTETPKGKWYCDGCSEQRRKRASTSQKH